ncbi:(Fe-S)-binding protein [Paenisporosarcina indica]|uniref:(Fe-S)-binding protein n=1 Tax=Paenisporosarcina indica TaxID=650093 RepID=UPI00094FECB0|nr:(Fe-S)-binding protein [Paenisporosarcina indica]
MRVTLFSTCLVDLFYSNVGISTVELLEKLGCEVDYPKGQICCGQPAYNSGYKKDAKTAMKQLIKTFDDAEYVVTPSGSCALMLREYGHIFADDEKWAARSKALSVKTYELTDFIVNVLGIDSIPSTLQGKAVFHTSCHMTRLLGVKEEPKLLLSNVEKLEMKPLANAQNCCGFGGTFSVKMGDISAEMVQEKTRSIQEADVDYVIGADCGCLMNIGGRLKREKQDVEVLHIAEVLNRGMGV